MQRRLLGGWLLVGVLAATVAIPAQAEIQPAPGMRDRRVRTALFDADQIYRLEAHVGYQIEIEFEPGERVIGQGAGDLEGIAFDAFSNHLFIKPKADDVSTNITVVTNRRRYRFHYTVSADPIDLLGEAIYVVRFAYPHSESVPNAEREIELEFERAARERSRNVDYWYCGHPSVRPVSAWDDGVHTRLTFASHSELPALFVRNDDETESLLNFSIHGADVVIHRVAKRFIVRRGRLAGCIVNQGYVGTGARLETGTVAPGVERRGEQLQ